MYYQYSDDLISAASQGMPYVCRHVACNPTFICLTLISTSYTLLVRVPYHLANDTKCPIIVSYINVLDPTHVPIMRINVGHINFQPTLNLVVWATLFSLEN